MSKKITTISKYYWLGPYGVRVEWSRLHCAAADGYNLETRPDVKGGWECGGIVGVDKPMKRNDYFKRFAELRNDNKWWMR